MKKILVGISAVIFLNTVVIASEWWQVDHSTHKCGPVAGNMSPYDIKKTIIRSGGSVKFLIEDSKNKMYIIKIVHQGQSHTISMADGYANCNTLVNAMIENGLL